MTGTVFLLLGDFYVSTGIGGDGCSKPFGSCLEISSSVDCFVTFNFESITGENGPESAGHHLGSGPF